MPELPEVETIRRDLAPELEGRTIIRVRVHKPDIVLPPRTESAFRRQLRGRCITRLTRRGKYLLLELDSGAVVQVQLRMTGRFALGRGRAPDPQEFRHVAAEFLLDDGRTLYYDDVRRLGGFRLLSGAEWRSVEEGLGPEPLGPGFRAADLAESLSGTRSPVKLALLDQARIAGVGNIYASEALHLARIDPRRPSDSLRRDEIGRLHRAVRRVLREATGSSGTTLRNYRAVNGRSGRFQERLRAYGREGERCRRCRGTIQRIVQSGRSTFLCPDCQT